EAILDYLQALINYSRSQFDTGLSPRAGLGLKQCAQAWAMCEGRDFVIPEDIQAVLPSIVTHRMQTDRSVNIAKQMLEHVAI
ncbi:MAG TPA: AAA family ATPase, partial [Methylophilaceae bacterium]|nr:AAA family ATPase [Methylophilaceae bacterium]